MGLRPTVGRPSADRPRGPYTRHARMGGGALPYLIVYRLRDGTVEILRLWHARRDWQSESDTD
ncbi:MAG TPA: type II toxin-antitoxin system RelE/ParE family toxin [Gammaproteobacteria bacterium]